MIIIPAIDIKNGKCVRLTQGRFDAVKIYGDDPVEVARKFEKVGAKFIHVVDLDGAQSGEAKNLEIILRIVKNVSIPIQVGGGIRSKTVVDRLMNCGVSRVVIGTIALENKLLLKKLLDEYGERIAVALDARGGKLVVKGWIEESTSDVFEEAKDLENAGVKRFVYTDVLRDGMLVSPNIREIKKLLKIVSVPVVVGGGISKIDDIKMLNELGVEGIIVGKAIYEGKINLMEALLLC